MRAPAYNDGPSFARMLDIRNWSWTVIIIVINVLVFLADCTTNLVESSMASLPPRFHPGSEFFMNYLALSRDGLLHGYVWQLLSYQFLHASILHIFFNCWAIYVFGRILEARLGSKSFLLILLSSGVVGGLVQVAVSWFCTWLWPQWYMDGSVVGASAGAFGLVAAFATLFPEQELTMLLFLIIPVRLRAKTLLLVSAALAFGGVIFPATFDSILGGNVANAAHLGGMFAGVIYVRKIILGRWFHGRGMASPYQPYPPAPPKPRHEPFWRHKNAKPGRTETELTPDELLRTQVDPILDKISAHGLHSLTPREREILERASGKLAKR